MVGEYEELEDDSSAVKMDVLRKMKLHIAHQSLQDDDAAENKQHEKRRIEVLRSDETEMKPECIPAKKPLSEADDSLDAWGRSLGSGISDIGPSYVMPDNLEELPAKLLAERRTVPLTNPNSNDLKQSQDLSEPSLFRDRSKGKWDTMRIEDETDAMEREMKRLKNEERISKSQLTRFRKDDRLSPNNLAVPKCARDFTGDSQDLTDLTDVEYKEDDDEHSGLSDNVPYTALDYMEQKSMEQIANSSDSSSIKHYERKCGERL